MNETKETVMSVFVVWIDRESARIFQFSREKMERRHLEAPDLSEHHTHRFDELDRKRRDSALFSEVATFLAEAQKILILGPGVAKHHFRTYLLEHHPTRARSIVGCETVDHPTDSQIAAQAKKFFGSILA